MAMFARTGIERLMALSVAALGAATAACPPAREQPHDARSATSANADPIAPGSSAPAPAGEPRVYARSTKSIEARLGDRFFVALPGNVTTGFQWRQQPPADAAVLTSSAPTYEATPPAGCAACVGYGGTFLFPFAAAGAGTTKVHFAYVQVGRDPPPPAEELTIEVKVSPP